MENAQTIENFYGVYLLYCLNPKYTGRTYIGYTVDPNRRIKQHNKGKQFGGAWRTSNRGPWTMFEWAWQHPHSSRRLQHVTKKKSKEKVYDFCLRVLSEMLQVGPWNRLPLTVQWLNDEFAREFPIGKGPPMHIPICYGAVISKKIQKNKSQLEDNVDSSSSPNKDLCYVCFKLITEDSKRVTCLNSNCNVLCHVICMSKHFFCVGEYIPIEGKCPKCENQFLWGDIVRKFKGCYGNIDVKINVEEANNFYCSDEDDN